MSTAVSSEPKPLTLAEVERQIIASAIQRMDVCAAAKALGINRATLYRKLRQYNLPRGTELPEFARLMQTAANVATFLERCSGTTAPALSTDLRQSMLQQIHKPLTVSAGFYANQRRSWQSPVKPFCLCVSVD